jgi:hypothetical protein
VTLFVPKSIADHLGYDLAEAVDSFKEAVAAHALTVNEPAPVAEPLVEEIVRGYGSFEIVDDTPIPTPAELRYQATQAVLRTAAERIAALASPARRQLAAHDLNAIGAKPNRTAAEEQRLADLMALFASIAEIERHSLLLQIEVEDLADDQVAGWQPHSWPA